MQHTKSKYEIYGEDITEIRDIDTVSSQNSKCCFVIKVFVFYILK